MKEEIAKMTIKELLELLNGAGLVIVNDDLIKEELNRFGLAEFDTIKIYN